MGRITWKSHEAKPLDAKLSAPAPPPLRATPNRSHTFTPGEYNKEWTVEGLLYQGCAFYTTWLGHASLAVTQIYLADSEHIDSSMQARLDNAGTY
jgi:hypothetical protein